MALALALMLMLSSPGELTAYQTWDALSWEYQLAPLSLRIESPGEGINAVYAGLDPQGRSFVTLSPFTPAHRIPAIIAHEAYHAMQRSAGVAWTPEEELRANEFGYCWTREPGYAPRSSCADVLVAAQAFAR